jgi:hypothetical protein
MLGDASKRFDPPNPAKTRTVKKRTSMSEKFGGKAAVSPDIREIQERLAKLKDESERRLLLQQQQDFKALQLEPFPNWPDDRRAVPNDMLRSALFGVVQRGRRKTLENLELPAPPGWKLYYTGKRLDQIDLDIWLEIMHRSRMQIPGEAIRFTLRSILHTLGHKIDGRAGYRWLKGRLKSITHGGFSYQSEDGKQSGATGSLLRGFHIDETTGEGIAETNPRLRSLYKSITYLDFTERLSLDTQLAKWLHALLASHARWIPTKVKTMMKQSGASYSRLRDFRADLRGALDVLKAHEVIRSWDIDTNDLVHIEKDGTPSQQRHIARSRRQG